MNEDRGSRYHRLRRRAVLAATAGGMGWLLLLLLTGLAAPLARLAGMAGGLVPAPVARGVSVSVFVFMAALGYEAVSLPFTVYRSFVLERRYGLSFESRRTWVIDHVKAALVGLLLTLGGAIAVVAAIDGAPRWWWVLATAVFIAAGLIVAILAPIALMPLFYRINPLDRDGLRQRLLALSQRAGVRVLGAYEWGLGEKTTRANAALVGLGKTRRILVSDTLLHHYSDDEIEVILAHEIAHHVHRDVWSGLVFESAAVGVGLLTSQLILHRWGPALGIQHPGDLTVLPLIALVVGGLSLAVAPLRNAWSRYTERRADRFALDLTHRPAAFISAMRRLGAQNLADERPSPATVWFFHTHPTIDERIEAARRFRAA
jgi:STE24 endopeptidase